MKLEKKIEIININYPFNDQINKFLNAISDYNTMINKGLIKPRGNNLLPIEKQNNLQLDNSNTIKHSNNVSINKSP